MGQAPSSSEPPELDHRTADPPTLPPTGLALIAHGRLGGTLDCPIVGALAACLRERHGCRVVTWSARGIANSKGVNEWGDLDVWVGNKSSEDYNVSPDVNACTEQHDYLRRITHTCFSTYSRECFKWRWSTLLETSRVQKDAGSLFV